MDRGTYKILKRAFRNDINETELKKIKVSNPVLQSRIKYMLNEMNGDDIDGSFLVTKFSKLENSPTYKDELIITYLLFLGKIINNSMFIHTFYAPQSMGIFNWISAYKQVVYSIVNLLYNKKFVDEDWIELDNMIYSLNNGDSKSVRNFLAYMKVLSIDSDFKIDMETTYDQTFILRVDQFGPLYWRMLHFMAEATNVQKKAIFAKNIWKDYTINLLYRTLFCTICKEHYQKVVEKYRNELENSSDYATLWFDIHNNVNKTLNKPEYTQSEFQKDQLIMRELLSVKKQSLGI